MHGAFVGTLVCTSGASAKDADTSNKNAAGSTAAIDLTGVPKRAKLFAQADVAFRLTQIVTSAVNAPGAGYGPKIDVGQLYEFEYFGGTIAAIPASGSGSANVDLWRVFDSP